MARMALPNHKPRTIYALGILVCVIVILAILQLTGAVSILPKHAQSGTIPTISSSAQKASSDNKRSSQSSQPDQKPNNVGSEVRNPPTDTALVTPYGSFVSNHRPNLDGSPAPSTEQSLCTTTPGATCTINFTNGDVKKSLAAQKADSNGLVSWTWDINQAGFTEGTWDITVTASLNGKSEQAKDNIALEVGP
jgi:hypothetical protein